VAVERKWFDQTQPQTMQVAVMLLYLTAILNLIVGFIIGGGGFFLLLVSAGLVGGAYGMANEQKTGYTVALIFACLPIAILIGLSIYYHRLLFPGFLNLVMQVALIALLLHPQTREYKKVWFK
jgi:hypothetical protein